MKMRGRSHHGQRNRAVIYRGNPGERIGPKAPGTPVDETHLECPKCHAGVRVRLDGTLFGHAIGGGGTTTKKIPCIGSGAHPVGAEAVA